MRLCPALLLTFAALCLSHPLYGEDASVPAGRTQFVCNSGYSHEQCRLQIASLRRVLQRYAAESPQDWTWVLVRSGDWKALKLRLGLTPDSPAFSDIARRETFLEEALVAPVPGRSAELIRAWSSSIDDLLALAVTHELGHAVCREQDEHQADAYGKVLRAGKAISCR